MQRNILRLITRVIAAVVSLFLNLSVCQTITPESTSGISTVYMYMYMYGSRSCMKVIGSRSSCLKPQSHCNDLLLSWPASGLPRLVGIGCHMLADGGRA